MPNVSQQKNMGAYCYGAVASASANSGAPSLITAGGTGDNVAVTGQTINREKLPLSGKLCIPFLAALTDTESISFTVAIQESADGSSWDSAETLQSATVAATSSGGSNEHGVVTLDVDLSGRKQYVRFNITPDLSASDTDTALFAAVFVLGGDDLVPAAVG